MTFGGANPITARAALKTLNGDQQAAEAREAGQSRAALDEAELRELEHAEYYGGETAQAAPAVAPPAARRRSLLDRILGR